MIAPPDSEHLARQLVWLFVLAIPIAAISRTVVFEEVFREPRQWCENMSHRARSLLARKFFYLFTCEYCFSHYVILLFLLITRYKLLFDDWRGYLISFFALVLVTNAYLNLYARLRVDITREKVETEAIQNELKQTRRPPKRPKRD